MTLIFILFSNLFLERFFILSRPFGVFFSKFITFDLGENGSRLLAAHHRYSCIRPGPEHSRTIGSTAHAIVSGTMGTTNDDCIFGYIDTGHGHDHLCTVLCNPAMLIFFADHETTDILKKQQRDISLTT